MTKRNIIILIAILAVLVARIVVHLIQLLPAGKTDAGKRAEKAVDIIPMETLTVLL